MEASKLYKRVFLQQQQQANELGYVYKRYNKIGIVLRRENADKRHRSVQRDNSVQYRLSETEEKVITSWCVVSVPVCAVVVEVIVFCTVWGGVNILSTK